MHKLLKPSIYMPYDPGTDTNKSINFLKDVN